VFEAYLPVASSVLQAVEISELPIHFVPSNIGSTLGHVAEVDAAMMAEDATHVAKLDDSDAKFFVQVH
jgi:hypothetical protein